LSIKDVHTRGEEGLSSADKEGGIFVMMSFLDGPIEEGLGNNLFVKVP